MYISTLLSASGLNGWTNSSYTK